MGEPYSSYPKVTFDWDGKKYKFNSSMCMARDGIVVLPDQTRLQVESWKISCPPHPVGFKVLRRGTHGVPAEEVTE